MKIDLDYDEDLNGDANEFGIGLEELTPPKNETVAPSAHPLEVAAVADPDNGSSELGLNDAIALAAEACKWESTFYGWCNEYLHGVKQEAIQDISLVRYALSRMRNYWGPMHFNARTPKAHERYYAIMAAQAVLSAVERRNKSTLIQKIIYYTGMVERGV